MMLTRLACILGALVCLTTVANAETFESLDKSQPMRIERSRSDIIEVQGSDVPRARCDYVYHLTASNTYILGGCTPSTGSRMVGSTAATAAHGRIRLKLVKP